MGRNIAHVLTPIRTPNFFLVGAPRCATTAMHTWLGEHPEVFLPRKEIHYFGSDLTHRRAEISHSEYLSFFQGASVEQRVVGEAAAWYLLSEKACEEIQDVSPDARILIQLRRPDQMLYSLHQQLLYAGEEDLETFSEALAAEVDRQAGLRIPNSLHLGFYAPPLECLLYREVAAFGTQVTRYIDTFGRDRVHVVFFEDLVAHPEKTYAEVCRFLGVDAGFQPDFEVLNAGRDVRFLRLRDGLNALRWGWLRGVAPPSLRALGAHLFSAISELNTRVEPRVGLDSELARGLIADLSGEIDLLEACLERDLSAWRVPAE